MLPHSSCFFHELFHELSIFLDPLKNMKSKKAQCLYEHLSALNQTPENYNH